LKTLLLLWLLVSSAAPHASAEEFTLGIFAYRPKPVMLERYSALADYLSTELDSHRVRLEVLDQDELATAINQRRLDFVMTNPSHFLLLRSQNSLTGAIATQVSAQSGLATDSLGGVIFTRADNPYIHQLSDLANKQVAAAGQHFLGGYQTQVLELEEAGIKRNELEWVFLGNQDQVMFTVMSGESEAGFVRTGIIERMIADGRLFPEHIRVINQQQLAGFPYRVSTRLYPEWPFIALPHVEQSVLRKVAAALMALDPQHPAAVSARIAGFTPAKDYQVVEQLARTLRIAPYDQTPEFRVSDVWSRFKQPLLWLAVSAVTVVLLLLILLERQRRLARLSGLLKASEEKYRDLVHTAGSIILRCNTAGELVFINDYGLQFFGYTEDELLGIPVTETIVPQEEVTGRNLKQWFTQVLLDPESNQYSVNQNVRKDGSRVWVAWSNTPIRDQFGNMEGLLCVGTDFSLRKQMEEQLTLAATVFEHAREAILITDPDGVILDCNNAFTRITGYSVEESRGQTPAMLSSGRHDREFYQRMWQSLRRQGYWSGEIWNRRKNGEVYAEMLTISSVKDVLGAVQCYVALFSDITEMKEQQKKLEFIAHYDALTGLPNRTLFADRLQLAMKQSLRRKKMIAVAFIDLDGFKAINDTWGHDAGDALLKGVAACMKEVLRSCDTLARLGGDEFVVILSDLDKGNPALDVIERLLKAAGHPVLYQGARLQVSASLGVTYYPQFEPQEADQLLRQADQAMYQAKLSGKNRYFIFDSATLEQ
jgi:diguanylate cyclase (GGDEF)-like protein/PAS domain S-box-containing protein